MGISRYIPLAIAYIEKQAAGFGDFFDPGVVTHNDSVRKAEDAAQMHMVRGIAKGIKEAPPAALNMTAGVPYSIAGGVASFLDGGNKHSWQSFVDGYLDNQDSFKNYVTDPIRKAEMKLGGDIIKRNLDRSVDYFDDRAGGAHPVNQTIENMMSGATTLAMTWPLFTKAISYSGKLGSLPSKIPGLSKLKKPLSLGAEAMYMGLPHGPESNDYVE